MNSTHLRELENLFSHFAAYRMAIVAARDLAETCECYLSASTRRYELYGSCAAAEKPPASCQTVVHLGVRVHLATIGLAVDHMDDDELDVAIDEVLPGLVLRAPQLTTEQFVRQLKAGLHADRVTTLPLDGQVHVAPLGTPPPTGSIAPAVPADGDAPRA